MPTRAYIIYIEIPKWLHENACRSDSTEDVGAENAASSWQPKYSPAETRCSLLPTVAPAARVDVDAPAGRQVWLGAGSRDGPAHPARPCRLETPSTWSVPPPSENRSFVAPHAGDRRHERTPGRFRVDTFSAPLWAVASRLPRVLRGRRFLEPLGRPSRFPRPIARACPALVRSERRTDFCLATQPKIATRRLRGAAWLVEEGSSEQCQQHGNEGHPRLLQVGSAGKSGWINFEGKPYPR